MKKRAILLFGNLLLVTGCATQNVPAQKAIWENKSSKIAVALTSPPKPGVYILGTQGFIDQAISNNVTHTFTNKLKQYNLENFTTITSDFNKKLRSKGIKVVNYGEFIDINQLKYSLKNTNYYAQKNFRPLIGRVGADKLLLISINHIGAMRYYYGFIPLGAPKAICYAEGRLIDLQTNRILWRKNVKVSIPVAGWHQPPNYPNFIRTLNTAVADSKAQLLTSFFG